MSLSDLFCHTALVQMKVATYRIFATSVIA